MKENSPKELGGVWTTAKYVQSQKLEKQLPTPGYSKASALVWSGSLGVVHTVRS